MSPTYATRDQTAEQCRPFFLDAIARLAPEVLKSLFEEVLPTYQEVVCYSRARLPMTDEIVVWADRFHLNEPWILDAALDVIHAWRLRPQSVRRDRWPVALPFDISGNWPWGVLRFEACWESPGESRGMARRRLLNAFTDALDSYLDEEAAKIPADYECVPRFRSLQKHLEWLVWYQVKGLNFSEVARLTQYGTRTVSAEVHAAAELIGLRLRPPRRGRPRRK